MLNRKSLWFRSFSSVQAALLLYFLCGREYAWAREANRAAQERLLKATANLGLLPEQVTDPASWSVRQKALAAQRRKESLQKLREITHAEEQEAKAKKARDTANKIVNAEPEKVRRELARAKSLKLSATETRKRLAGASPAFALAAKSPKSPKVAPESKPPLGPERLKPKLVPMAPPRTSPQHGALTPEVKALYASAMGQGAWVEQDDGSLLSPEEALSGVAPPPVRLAGLVSDLGLGLPLLGALPAPTPDDVTPPGQDVQQRAQSLGSVAALFNFVHTQIAPELYYGSKKGASETLAEGGGNDFDQASLLIALLRALGIPARYEYGTVNLSAAQAMSLTGAVDIASAASMLSKTSPAVLSPDGTSVQMERAWVRAYVGFSGGLGTNSPNGTKLWVRLDPGLKRVSYSPAVNLKGVVHFNFDAYTSQLTQQTPREVYEGQLLAAARAQNLCNNLDQAVAQAQISEDNFRLLPAEHPAHVVQSLLLFSRPPTIFRHQVQISLDGQTQAFELVDLQGHSLSLQYPGTAPADQSAIASAGGIANVIPYQVQVTPTLMLDGQAVAQFAPVNPGSPQLLSVQVTVPGGNPVLVDHHIVAGSLYAVLVQGGTVPQSRVDALQKAMQGQSGDALILAQSQLALAWYAHNAEADSRRMFALNGHSAVKDVLEGIAGKTLQAQFSFGVPVALAPGNYVLDVARDSLTPLPRDSDASLVPELVRLSGYDGSALEHKTWEFALSSAAFSTMNILQAAGSQLVPVYKLTSPSDPNLANLTGYSQSTLTDVAQALGAQWTVTIPQHPVNYLRYQNVEGYILQNPVDGWGAYRINETINGGATDGSNASSGAGDGCTECGTVGRPTSSTVNLANGNMRESMADLMLPTVGLPIAWSRTYASRAATLTEIGYGWMHSYGMFLQPQLDGSFVYFTEDWRQVTFTPNGSGGFTSSPGWHMALTSVSGGHQIQTKDGIQYSFNSFGQLTRIAEPSGNHLDLVYSSGLLSQLLDSNGQVALSFNHAGNKISQVTDRAGRTVSYTYSTDDLASATDVLGHSESYVYDNAHNLTQRTDKRGQVWLEFYDILDRWVGFKDPAGQEASASYDFINQRTVYVDRTGAPWTYEFNAAGNPTAAVDPLGNREESMWDGDFNKTSAKDSRGYATSMTYDAKGNLLQRNDPDGRVSNYSYEPNFSRMTFIGQTGLPDVNNSYDSAGRLTARTDGLGTTSYTYDAKGQLASATQPGNATTSFGHDANGNVTKVTDPTNGPTNLVFDSAGHLASITDPNNNTRQMTVDAAGRVVSMLDALNNKSTFAYDAAGNRLSATDPTGTVTSFSYDSLGRMTQTTDAGGNVRKTAYDAEGRPTSQLDARGNQTQTTYDAAGRTASMTTADGATTTQGFCAALNSTPCATVDALGNLTQRQYDAMGRATTVTDPLGRQTNQGYDLGGRLSSVAGPNQPATTYRYDGRGVLQAVFTPATFMTYDYDGRGNRTSVRVGNGASYQYGFDGANRLLSETNPLNQLTSYTYDAAGNRASKKDGNGNLTTYAYDANRRLRTVNFADGTSYQFDYDARGNRTREKSPTHERQMAYDGLNRLAGVVDVTTGRNISFTYDANGNRASLTEGNLNYRYAYDGLNRLKAVTDTLAQTTAFDYDALGRRTSVARPNGVITAYAYDSASQALNITHSKAGNVLAGFAYAYDVQGSRMSKTLADGTIEAYQYDGAQRLTQASYGTSRAVSYGLDQVGNRISSSDSSFDGAGNFRNEQYQYNLFNQMTQRSQIFASIGNSTVYAYDANGNLLSENLTQGSTSQIKSYTWNLDDRLTSVTLPSGTTDAFAYDANGLRIKRTDSTGTTNYLLDGPSVLEELDATNSTRTGYLTNPQVINEILSFQQANATYYPLTDALGSIYALTDGSGAVVRANSYDLYGAQTTNGSGPSISFGFAGREHEVDSRIIFNRQRERDPSTGAWMQADRLGQALYRNGGVSAESWLPMMIRLGKPPAENQGRYLYAEAAPTRYTNPSGLFVLYTGLTGSISSTFLGVSAIGSLGGVFGFAGVTAFSSALAITYGIGVSTNFPNLSGGGEFGIYWGLEPDEACSYGGPFASFGVDAMVAGVALVWAIDPKFLETGHPKLIWSAVSSAPVGVSFSATASLEDEPSLSFVVTKSIIKDAFNCRSCSTGQ